MPTTICRIIDGRCCNADYDLISMKEAMSLVEKEGEAILKPSVGLYGGQGIQIWHTDDGIERLREIMSHSKNIVVQSLFKQHQEMSSLHKESLNTIRLVTLLYKNEVHHLSTVVRMGVGKSFVDNASSGGIFCGVNANGHLKNVAYDKNGKRFEIHPQGAIFAEHYIPNYEECIALVKHLAPRFSRISKLLSWDLAVDEKGHPALIEVNMCYGELDFHQIANGPLLGDLTDEIVNEVFKSKINRLLRKFF